MQELKKKKIEEDHPKIAPIIDKLDGIDSYIMFAQLLKTNRYSSFARTSFSLGSVRKHQIPQNRYERM